MKQGGDPEINSGFTIVEVLIVLAVTGLLFVSAVLLINGRQNKTEFTVAINNAKQQFQQIINETASGYYPGGSLTCTAGTAGNPPTITAAGGAGQSSNGQCIFLGKALRIGGQAIDPTYGSFTLYPLAANRTAADGSEILDPASVNFAAIAPGQVYNPNAPDRSEAYTFQNGLSYQWLKYKLTGAGWTGQNPQQNASMVALAAASNATYNGNQLGSGATNLGLYAFTTSVGTSTGPALVDKIDQEHMVPLDYIQLCLASGGTNQSGLITIGSDSGGLAVKLQISSGQVCANPL